MKIKLRKNWNPGIDSFQLTGADIEKQAATDLLRYRKVYFEKYRRRPSIPLDIDHLVKELWDVEVEFSPIQQSDGENETLGYLDAERRKIIVDSGLSQNQNRTSFTVAHEAGHLSLHTPMFKFENGLVTGWQNQVLKCEIDTLSQNRRFKASAMRREWQANKYAAAILAPKEELVESLVGYGLASDNSIIRPIDLAKHAEPLQQKFGLSRYALEIRLSEIGAQLINRKYGD